MKDCLERIENFIKKQGYTWSAYDVVHHYRYLRGSYMSWTMKVCIEYNLNDLKYLDKYLKKRNR